MNETPKVESDKTKFRPVMFIHRRLPSFHIVHADGVWGTINSEGFIHLNFFAEQSPVPESVVLEVNKETGAYTGEHSMPPEDENHFVVYRDMVVDVVIGLNAAIRFRNSLDTFIESSKQNLEYQRKQSS